MGKSFFLKAFTRDHILPWKTMFHSWDSPRLLVCDTGLYLKQNDIGFITVAIGGGYISKYHYCDAIMGIVAQITSLTIVYTTVYSDTDLSRHQSCASLAFVWGIHRGPVNSPHKWPVTRKMFPFDDVIMTLDYRGRWEVFQSRHRNVADVPVSLLPNYQHHFNSLAPGRFQQNLKS